MMSRPLVPIAVTWLGIVGVGLWTLSGRPSPAESPPKAAGAAVGATVTWVVISEAGSRRETVPPLVLYVDSAGRKRAGAIAEVDQPWAVKISKLEMGEVAALFDFEKSVEKAPLSEKQTELPQRQGKTFTVVFGGEAGKVASFARDPKEAQVLVVRLGRSLLTSPDAIQAAREFAKAYGW